MKDLYTSKDTIKGHQGREQRRKYQDSISAPRQWWQKLSGNYLEILESQFPWKGSQFPGKGLDGKSWLISGNFSLNWWLDVWPHGRQLHTCSWKSLTVACRSQLGRQDLVLPVSGAYVWLLIATCDSAGTKAGTFMAATPTSTVAIFSD